MEMHTHLRFLGMLLALAFVGGVALAGDQGEEPLEGREWQSLSMETGFHSVTHKKSGLEARLLEADGSSSVAQDPISLFLVVTNNDTADYLGRAWRLRRGVARVRRLSASTSGIDVKVEVDGDVTTGGVSRAVPKVLHICFLAADGKLLRRLKVTETPR